MLTVYTPTRATKVPIAWLRNTLKNKEEYRKCYLLTDDQYEAFTRFFRGEKTLNIVQLSMALDNISPWSHTRKSYTITFKESGDSFRFNEPRPLTLISKDGDECSMTNWHEFQFLVDYLEAYPDTEKIELNFSRGVIVAAIYGSDHARLDYAYDCVSLLNPNRNTYYLDYDLTGMDAPTMITIAQRFTRDERRELKLAYKCSESTGILNIPEGGEGYCILAAAKSVFRNIPLTQALFGEDYPSWVHACMRDIAHKDTVNHFLTADFSIDAMDDNGGEGTGTWVSNFIYSILETQSVTSWEEVARLLAMMGMRSKALKNEEMIVIAPYGATPERIGWKSSWSEKFAALYPGEWKDSYYVDAM